MLGPFFCPDCDFKDESQPFFKCLPSVRMDTTEQCNAVISHFNGKFVKMGSGALGREFHLSVLPVKTVKAP